MAHNINSMMYHGERPWHGLGKEVANVATAAGAITAAGLDWTVEQRRVYYVGNSGLQEISSKRLLVRQDTGAVFNVMGDGFRPIQNREAFSFFDAIVGEGQAIYHTAGALGAGERVWILAKLPNDIIIEGTEDRMEKFLLLSNAHDGTAALRIYFTPVRVVCQNTLNLAASGRAKGEGIAIRHTSGALNAVAEARRALGIAVKFYDQLGGVVNELAVRKAGLDSVKAYFQKLVPDNPKAENKTRTQNIRITMMENFRHGLGNDMRGIEGSWWSAVNAVTEYVDHDRTARGDSEAERRSNRLESQWFGTGARLKAEAWDLALDYAGVKIAQ